MGITRARAVKKQRKKNTEKAIKAIVYPPVIVGALLFGTAKKKRKKHK